MSIAPGEKGKVADFPIVPSGASDSGKVPRLDANGKLADAFLYAAPAGIVSPYAGATAPAGWLLCDGSIVSQSTYSVLYAIVGATYNTTGEGAGNFRLPNLKGKVPVGKNASETEFDVLGETGGAKTHTLTEAELAAHTHGIPYKVLEIDDGGGSTYSFPGGATQHNVVDNGTTGPKGSGTAHNNIQPYITLNYIIKF
jgi:microcystin-dependent protein